MKDLPPPQPTSKSEEGDIPLPSVHRYQTLDYLGKGVFLEMIVIYKSKGQVLDYHHYRPTGQSPARTLEVTETFQLLALFFLLHP